MIIKVPFLELCDRYKKNLILMNHNFINRYNYFYLFFIIINNKTNIF